MTKYKEGDKFKAKKDFGIVKAGEILIAKDHFTTKDLNWYAGEGFVSLHGYLNDGYGGQYLELVKEEEEMQFDMKKNNWYITFSNEEEFNLVQEWLKSKGFSPKYSDKYDADADCFTKAPFSDSEDEYIRDSKSCAKAEGAEEIKIKFKIVIDCVTFPEVKSERNLKIEELEQSIKEAQALLNELKALK